MSVYEAINKVMDEVGAVAKNDKNIQQKFNFRGIDAVVNAISPALRKHGLTCRPTNVISIQYKDFTSKSGALGVACKVVVEYTFTDTEGSECKSIVAAEANDYGDKSTPKAMSVAYRTCLLQTFTLPTNDVDPDAETYEMKPASNQAAPTTIQRPQFDKAHWEQRISECPDKDALRDLWEEAKGQPKQVLDLISAAAKEAAA